VIEIKKWGILALCALSFVPPPVGANDSMSWEGTFYGHENQYVSIKKLVLSNGSGGQIKAQAWLVGFPEDVALGETTAEQYQEAHERGRNNNSVKALLLSFNENKVKAVISVQISRMGDPSKGPESILCNAFIRNPDGSKVYSANSNLNLAKEP